MKGTFIARAPGKLFLAGEYAVLDGAPAIVAAVDRYVEVRLRLEPATRVTRIEAPGHCDPLEITPGAAPPARAELRFVLAAIGEVRTRLELTDCGLEIQVLSALENGAGAERKLGLGGSAAVTAAVTAALFAAAGRDVAAVHAEIFAAALAAHRAAQGNSGSGADVAAAVHGGLLLFEPRPESPPRLGALALPAGAALLAAWSGRAAATGPLVQGYLALERGARAAFVDAARAAVAALAGALAAGRVDPAALDRNGEALESLALGSGLPLLTPELDRIVALAREAGAGAKISGAGGGDCAIALAADADTAARVRRLWREAGIEVLELNVAPQGVSVGQA